MHIFRPALATLALPLLIALTACGGGGGSDSAAAPAATASSATSAASAASAATPAPTASAPAVTASAPTPLAARLSGVAALGAPMSAARVTVLDGTGAMVGSATTNPADGSYALTLQPAIAPLMIQATGTDATGQPLVLHSAVSTLAATTFANITPFTDAIVALTLGNDPKPVFADATAKPATMAPLATLAPAATFLKTLVKTNLSDAKTGDATKLDLIGDNGFAANKTGVDLALETLSMTYGSSPTGAPVLQITNKLSGAAAEVVVDLAVARTELAKTTGGKPANAITSTLKATTSPTTTIASLGALDDLVTTLNKAIADGTGATPNVLTVQLLPRYTQHDGRAASVLAERIAGWTARKMQIGRMQVTGCADETIAKTGCVLVGVAARVSDASGEQVENLTDAVSYFATATPKWQLVGNGLAASVAMRPVAWLALENDGRPWAPSTPATPPVPNPNLGVQLAVGDSVLSATVQSPGGYVQPLVPCTRTTLCIAAKAGDTSVAPTGGLFDDSVFQLTNAWLGAADLAQGARYKVVLTRDDNSAVTRTSALRSSFAAVPATGRFATIDDVKSSQPLPGSALLSSTKLAWTQWAAANPDMRVVFVRTVLSSETQPPLITDLAPKSWLATSLQLAEPLLPEGFGVVGIELWIAAIDFAGRWYYTRYTLL